ncbi:MAG: AbrB/MazE/SpoVT family DNA-binding domain-containing protein [Candidatus Omnitrophica bacterium]|nr:AbrB/MazE/SpoVT family DNA-binding domain-containing protein [Candidatus Omnitrophota bacterium]
MIIARLKEKNQVTLPKKIVERLNLKKDEFFEVRVGKNYIILIPVELKPKYIPQELEKINKLITKEKKKAKTIKAGKKFLSYINNIK